MRIGAKAGSLAGGVLFLFLATTLCDAQPMADVTKSRLIRVACVGDSITFGQGLRERETFCYPAILGNLLGGRYEVLNFGVSGTTLLRKGDTPYWDTPEFSQITEYDPQIVIIMLGTNDSKPLNWWRHKKEFADDLRAMVDHFAHLPSPPDLRLCLPPPVFRILPSPNDCAIRKDIIPEIERVAKEKNLPLIDLYTPMESHPEHFPDNVRPNAAGAEVIARTVYEALTR